MKYQADSIHQLYERTSQEKLKKTYPEIFPLSALIACNAMNWPGGTAIYT